MFNEINQDTTIKAFGNIITVNQFADKHTDGDVDRALELVKVLIKKGNAIVIDNDSKEQHKINKAFKEELISSMAEMSEDREESNKDYVAQKKREGKLLYEEIHIEYPDFIMASQAEGYYRQELRLKDTEIRKINGQCFLVVKNITDKELNFINTTYKRDKAINGAMNMTQKGVNSITGAVDYTAKNIFTPALKIGAKGAVSIFKSVVSTVTRTGATVITSTSKGIKDTAQDIREDEEVLRATRDLIDTKDNIKRGIAKIGNNNGSTSTGITVIK